MEEWLATNWFEFISVVCGVGGLWFAGLAIHADAKARTEDAKARRVANLLTITANHRELWKIPLDDPALARIDDPLADLTNNPLTSAEEIFVSMAISHTSSTYEALKGELVTNQEELRHDVKSYYSLPIPKAVWSKTKRLQNRDFAAFIDSAL